MVLTLVVSSGPGTLSHQNQLTVTVISVNSDLERSAERRRLTPRLHVLSLAEPHVLRLEGVWLPDTLVRAPVTAIARSYNSTHDLEHSFNSF